MRDPVDNVMARWRREWQGTLEARRWIKEPGRWIRGWSARTATDQPTSPTSPNCEKCCLLGLCFKFKVPLDDVRDVIRQRNGDGRLNSVTAWNDDEATTLDDVVDVLTSVYNRVRARLSYQRRLLRREREGQ